MSKSYFYFPPWRKQFFFSKSLINNNEISYIYHPYILFSKIVWYIWKGIPFFRRLFSVSYDHLPDIFCKVLKQLDIDEHECTSQINVGTIGPEQKLTALLYQNNKSPLFIKVGTSELASKLILNESQALTKVDGKFGAPKVILIKDFDSIQILATEVVVGAKMKTTSLNNDLFSYILTLASGFENYFENELIYSMAHGDCCPWNFIVKNDNSVSLIDWELSAFRPLGYDLLTFIFQTSFLLSPQREVHDIYKENKIWIDRFYTSFCVNDVNYYFREIGKIFVDVERSKGDTPLLSKWLSFLIYFSN